LISNELSYPSLLYLIEYGPNKGQRFKPSGKALTSIYEEVPTNLLVEYACLQQTPLNGQNDFSQRSQVHVKINRSQIEIGPKVM